MSNPPWMPLHIADYLRDTTHLDAEQSGAYLHLIMAYWVTGGLPNDGHKLAKIAKISLYKWNRICPTLEAFFGPGFSSHKRIDFELQRAAKLMKKRSAMARAAARLRWLKHRDGTMPDALRSACTYTKKEKRKKDTGLEIEVGAVEKWSADEGSEAVVQLVQRMSRRKGHP